MTEHEAIERIRVAELKPDDIVCIRLKGNASDDTLRRCRAALTIQFPNVRFLIEDDAAEVSRIIRPTPCPSYEIP